MMNKTIFFSEVNKSDSEIKMIIVTLPKLRSGIEYYYPEGKRVLSLTGFKRFFIKDNLRDMFYEKVEDIPRGVETFIKGGRLYECGQIRLVLKGQPFDYSSYYSFIEVKDLISTLSSLSTKTSIRSYQALYNGTSISLSEFCSTPELYSLIDEIYGE